MGKPCQNTVCVCAIVSSLADLYQISSMNSHRYNRSLKQKHPSCAVAKNEKQNYYCEILRSGEERRVFLFLALVVERVRGREREKEDRRTAEHKNVFMLSENDHKITHLTR
jgi:hypothetical protein